MPSLRIVEALNVVEHVGLGLVRDRYTLRAVRSVFKDEKKLSIPWWEPTVKRRLRLNLRLLSSRAAQFEDAQGLEQNGSAWVES
jgi:hypothetical protein